jgi:hypothetical protein
VSALAISPATGIVRAGGQLTFVASGGTGTGYVFSFANPGDNASGGTLNSSTGAYVAGPRTVVDDTITVTDSGAATAAAKISISGGLYRAWQSTLVRTPDWQGPRIKLLEADLGSEKDHQLERARQGVLSNNPATCPDDALAYIGQERGLPQGVGESLTDYRERLRTAWDRDDGWSFAGSHGSLLFALERAGFPMGSPNGAFIMQRINLYSWLQTGVVTFGTHPQWNFDASPAGVWNQFGIIFGADFTPPVGSIFEDGDPSADLLNSIVATWKPAKARYMGARVMVAGPWWDWPVGAAWNDVGRNWGDGIATGLARFVQP